MPRSTAPYISVTMTCYNYANHMKRGLDAIRRNRYQDYEVVLIDDCSSDSTVEVIREYMAEHPEMDITLIENEENIGVQASRNKLIEAAEGKYIMFCDSDDWMDADCLEVLASAAQQHDADRVIAQFRDVDQSGKVLQVQDLPPNPSKWICGCHHGSIYRRDVFIENGIRFANHYPDDVYINVLFNYHCENVVFVHKTIYNWFVHTDSTSRVLKKDSPWIGPRMFEDACSYIVPMLNNLQGDDRAALELMLIKVYYLALYHSYRDATYRETLNGYQELHKIIDLKDPGYLRNKYLKVGTESPMRFYATAICRVSGLLERAHLMRPALLAYHILSKFYYFNL